ncbi:MAG: BamA/TamA family outer membrane protein [bacterium]
MLSTLVAVILAVQFGPEDSIAAVRFEGNRAFRDRTLRAAITSHRGGPLIERQLAADARLLATIYVDNGFRAVEVSWDAQRERRQWRVTFKVSEGVRSRVGAVRFAGNAAWDSVRLAALVTARPGRHLTAAMPAEGEARLAEFYNNNGYPFAQVDGEWEHRDTIADLIFSIIEGPRCHISALRVRGNRRVATNVVLRAIEVRPGELFSRRRLQEAQRRLYATRLFQRVLFYVLRPDGGAGEMIWGQGVQTGDAVPGTGEAASYPVDSVVIRYDVAEQTQHGLAFGAGFEAPPFRLLGSVDWQHLNVLGRAHVFEAGVEYSPGFTGDYRFGLQASYRVPYLFLNRVNFSFRPFFAVERIDTALSRELGAETGLSRELAPQLSAGLFNRFRVVADTASGVTNSVALNLQYDTRDDVFDPGQGVFLRPLAEVAGGLLQGSNDFYRVSGEARGFGRFGPGFVLAARAVAGSCFPYGSTARIPYYEAFTLGGRNNLRGYQDRSVGPDSTGRLADGGFRFGPMILNGSIELRSPYILGWVGLVAFADGGEVVGPEAGFSTGAFEYSAGAGVRVRTPIGPARVDWGKRLRNPPAGDRGRFYFGLLHAF